MYNNETDLQELQDQIEKTKAKPPKTRHNLELDRLVSQEQKAIERLKGRNRLLKTKDGLDESTRELADELFEATGSNFETHRNNLPEGLTKASDNFDESKLKASTKLPDIEAALGSMHISVDEKRQESRAHSQEPSI